MAAPIAQGAPAIPCAGRITQHLGLGTRHLQTLHGRLSKLVSRLAPEGAYSVTIVRQAGAPEIHAAFEKSEDADRLARTVGARADALSSDGASRRSFILDEATGAAISAGIAADGELDERARGTGAKRTGP